MNTQKFLISGIIGGVAYFFLGWLIWGILLESSFAMADDVAAVIDRGDEGFIMWAMAVSCIIYGLFLAKIFHKWAGISTPSEGAQAGAFIGAAVSLFVGLGHYSMLTYVTLPNVGLDVAANAVASGIVGGIIGWWLGRD